MTSKLLKIQLIIKILITKLIVSGFSLVVIYKNRDKFEF